MSELSHQCATDLGCLINTELINGPTLKGKLTDAEALALAHEIVGALVRFNFVECEICKANRT